MSQSLIGSRYETHIAKKGAQESKDARDYFAIHPGDIEEAQEGDDITGYVHSYEVGSTVDGPGIRFVAFLTGCLLRCQYCHNPDTWARINGRAVPLARAVEVLSQYRQGLKLMNGGFTLSGGEPLIQDRFAVRLFEAAKAMGIHTALDTNGHLGSRLGDDDLRAGPRGCAVWRSTRLDPGCAGAPGLPGSSGA